MNILETMEITLEKVLPITFSNGFGFTTVVANCPSCGAAVAASSLIVTSSFANGVSVGLGLEVRCGCGAEPNHIDTRMSNDGTFMHRVAGGSWVVKKFPATSPYQRLKSRFLTSIREVLKWKTKT